MLVSDGGHRHSGSYAWIIATTDHLKIASGQGPVDGALSLMSSFRAESTGILHGLIALGHVLFSLASTHSAIRNDPSLFLNDRLAATIQIHCDSKSLIHRLREWTTYPTFYPSLGNKCDSDLSLEIVGLITHEYKRSSVTFHHVRGHQDEKKPWDQLTWAEKLNVNCDKRATATLLSLPHIDRPSFGTLVYSNVDLLANNVPITNKVAQTVRDAYGSPEMRPYLCKKFNWASSTCDLVDWLCLG